ncbi:16843_t:CDS:2 [Funneliformis geosporum]|nr:16843_t:CDS:2 [Funneliformis geosporum]
MKEKSKITTKTVQRPLKVECFYTPPLGNKCGKIFEVKYNRSCVKVGSNDKDISDLQQKNTDLTKAKEEAEKQLKEKQQQILDHKCDTPNNAELNQVKEELKNANQEKDRLQTELNKKNKNIPIPQPNEEEDKKEEQENQKLTVEELREKLTSKQQEIRDLQEQLSKTNNSQSNNQDSKQNPKFLLGMMTAFLVMLIVGGMPDITKKNQIGEIISVFEKRGLRVAGMKMVRLTPHLAKNFYQEHSERSFFKGMTEFMCSSPVVVICLEGENAIKLNREIMGATNPLEAKVGTIRRTYGESIDNANAVHGSDSSEAAKREINLFFKEEEIF